MKGVSHLNGEERFWQSSDFSSRGCHEHRQNAVRSTHGLSPLEDFPSHCRSVRRRSLRKVYDMRRSIPRDGLRATDIPRESARHRGLSFGAVGQALPHGLAAGDQALADANEARDWRIHAEFAQRLINLPALQRACVKVDNRTGTILACARIHGFLPPKVMI